ncbi:hypothetical protein ABV409_13350 [Flagellimonas sp. DF-77]|uniref:hypothetical protein n=1 Tax=Flagellimonas algarum TaxID=3230298 RepID=UPI0033995FB8
MKRSAKLLRLLSMTLMAVMIGFSNSILEENRSINDTRARIEQQFEQADEEE